MGRIAKNYCDYFPHKNDMRNHRKIKALRNRFGIVGYALWCLTLEYLTGIDGNEFEFSDSELELISGDYGISVTDLSEFLHYCIKLELLTLKNGFLSSISLDEYLQPVYDKRQVAKSISARQNRNNGKYCNSNNGNNGITVTEMPQIKSNLIIDTNVSIVQVEQEKLFDPKETYLKIPIKDKKTVVAFFKENKPLFDIAYFDLWNLFASDFGLPKMRDLTTSRKAKLKVRMREQNFNFLEIILKASKSTFLKEGSFFTFDWIIDNDKNYLKILEGNYDNKN